MVCSSVLPPGRPLIADTQDGELIWLRIADAVPGEFVVTLESEFERDRYSEIAIGSWSG